MLRFPGSYGWASCLACLALALAAPPSFADEEEINESPSYEDQQSSSADESQSQVQHQSQQDQQRVGQQRQRGQQSQRGQRRWDNSQSRDPQWSRDRSYQYGRDSQRSGSARQGGLGVSIENDDFGAILVTRVYSDSPADEMGIKSGDRITRINGRQIQSTGEFISRIRNMQPGEEVAIEIERDSREQTFRGELAARQQALASRGDRFQGQTYWQQNRGNWQTGYEEEGRPGQSQPGRSSNVDRQIGQIERQLDQLSRQIEGLQFAIQEIRQQHGSGGETTARYDEYRERDSKSTREGNRPAGRWQDEGREGGRQMNRSRDSQSGQRGERSQRSQPDSEFQSDQGY